MENVNPTEVSASTHGLESEPVRKVMGMIKDGSTILRVLFEVCNYESLKVFRGVSKTWWRESLQIFRSRSKFVMSGSDADFVSFLSSVPSEDFRESFANAHFKNFELRRWESGVAIRDFCRVNGIKMKELTISNSKFKDVSELLPILTQFTPVLESLNLNYNDVKKGMAEVKSQVSTINPQKNLRKLVINCDSDNLLTIGWPLILHLYPNIKVLQLGCFDSYCEPYTEFEKLLLAMKAAMINSKKTRWELTKLDIIRGICNHGLDPFPPFVLDLLRELQFPLKSLAITTNGHVDEKKLSALLQLYSHSLEELVIFREHGPQANLLCGIELSALTKLFLIGTVCKNFRFLENTPNLKTLWIETDHKMGNQSEDVFQPFPSFKSKLMVSHRSYDFEPIRSPVYKQITLDFALPENYVSPFLKELIVNDQLIMPHQLFPLLQCLPNLKRLQIGLDNDGFRAICKHLPGLRALRIVPCGVDTFGITGIVPGLDYREPNITDLKDLRYFGMDTPSSADALLTNESIENGLLKLQSLHYCEIYTAYEVSTKETVEKLTSKCYPYSFRF